MKTHSHIKLPGFRSAHTQFQTGDTGHGALHQYHEAFVREIEDFL